MVLMIASCQERGQISSIDPVNWQKRTIHTLPLNAMTGGTTYLPIFSQIYSETEKRIHDLTATVSIRNTNRADSVYIRSAAYYNTERAMIRSYFDQTIFVRPMETFEIVIDQVDKAGGTGANFLFDWTIKKDSNEPFFEAVMISTYSAQGISFTTQGVRVN